ncbi:MAG: restriction endonuclease subunit S [Gammaproteobacteria bacterium]|nr:restriction endonuclease subunit S [Gammaproteobacteria bacterium]
MESRRGEVGGGRKAREANRESRERTDRVECLVSKKLPVSWLSMPIGSFISSIDTGKSYKCEEKPPEEGEYGLVKISAVTWKEYNENESKTCTRPDLVNENYLIRAGDFLISRANTLELVGAPVIAEGVTRKIMLSDKVLRLNFQWVNQRFVLYYLWSDVGRKEIEKRATGNQLSMRNIGQDRIRAIPIPIPSVAEQQEIVSRVEAGLSKADEMIGEVDTTLEREKSLRQSILKRAFEGKLVPQDPNDEPASVLLERIRQEQANEPKTGRRKRKAEASA